MSICHTKTDDFTKALECASTAAAIDRFSPTMLFRLSEAYGREKQYVQAQLHFERALSFLPVSERASYTSKLARIKEQAEDEEAHVYKEDPFDKFPLEVIILVMREGLSGDRDFVLKASHVNRTWRRILTNSCSELWKTLTFSHSGFKKKCWEDKMKAWAERAGTVESISFVDFTITAAERITKKQAVYLADARRLDIRTRDPEALKRLAISLSPFPRAVQDLRVQSYANWRRQGPPMSEIACGLLTKDAERRQIKSIQVDNISFHSDDPQGRHLRDFALFNPQSSVCGYSALKTLKMIHCEFENIPGRTLPSAQTQPQGSSSSTQQDPSHKALRRSPNLERLEVQYFPDGYREGRPYQPGQRERTTMFALKVAILPVPDLWSLDILAPSLEHLAFVVPPANLESWQYDRLLRDTPHRMIPTIEESPVAEDGLLKLKSFEVACYTSDGISQLEDWAPRMGNVTTFVLRNVGRMFPNKAPTEDTPDDRISTLVVRVLSDNLNWFPKMTELVLESCLTPGKDLVELVRRRKNGSGCASLQRIMLKTCSKLSDNAKSILQQEVPFFVTKGEVGDWMYLDVHYVDEDIELEAVDDGKQV